MTEQEFWQFMGKAWEKGRAAQSTMTTDSDDPEIQAAAEYIGGHTLLPANYQDIPDDIIRDMGELLFDKNAGTKTKEAVLMILAHQDSKEVLTTLERYTQDPDEGLGIFSELALSECRMWCD